MQIFRLIYIDYSLSYDSHEMCMGHMINNETSDFTRK